MGLDPIEGIMVPLMGLTRTQVPKVNPVEGEAQLLSALPDQFADSRIPKRHRLVPNRRQVLETKITLRRFDGEMSTSG